MTTTSSPIPIVDFAKARDARGTREEKEEVAREIDRAFSEVGFVYLRNHGVGQEKVEGGFEWVRLSFYLFHSVLRFCLLSSLPAHAMLRFLHLACKYQTPTRTYCIPNRSIHAHTRWKQAECPHSQRNSSHSLLRRRCLHHIPRAARTIEDIRRRELRK